METTDTDGVVLYHTCVNKHVNTSNCSAPLKNLWSDQIVHKRHFRNSNADSSRFSFETGSLVHTKDKRNKYQPATVFVALNIPPVRSDFPNLAMRAILEWTPGRAWRQSGKRELHFNDFKPLWKKNENIQRSAFHEDLVRPIFWHETIFYKYIQSLTVNAQGTIQIAVFSEEREVHRVKCLTSLVTVLTLLFSQLINFKVHPWTSMKSTHTQPEDLSFKKEMRLNYFQTWCQRMLKIKCSPDVSDPLAHRK